MYFKFTVPVPEVPGKICRKTNKNKNKNTHYIYYEYARTYNKNTQHTIPQRVVIGKECESDNTLMYPNPNYYAYFTEAEFPETDDARKRSSCLHVGMYLVIRKIIEDYKLDELIKEIIPQKSGLFLDLAAYSIISENNAGQYYPDYAYNHPLFTEGMKVYSDSTVSDFLGKMTIDQGSMFLNKWNKRRDHKEKIYISYDSTNKDCEAGDIDIAEFGYSKSGKDNPIVNYAVAYDRNNREPLFYEDYSGSITDISQFQYTLEKVKGYGYKNIGFILDRGYFSKDNIRFMDECGYDFIIMVKGMKSIVNEIVAEHKGTFEEDRKRTIRKFHVNGITQKRPLYVSDARDRYFHIYYSAEKQAAERYRMEMEIESMQRAIDKIKGKCAEMPKKYLRYFNPIYYHEGQEDQTLMGAVEKTDVITQELKQCGYFALITSRNMKAEDALLLYKSRDESEKLFRGDKSYLGNRSFRVHSAEALEAKILIEFVALIIRNKIYTSLQEECMRNESRSNYMNVAACIRELEKIEMIRRGDGDYVQDHAVTATQKAILNAFEINENDVKLRIKEISKKLKENMEVSSGGKRKGNTI